jgi:thiol-disulfide isomerase/thioredoxin
MTVILGQSHHLFRNNVGQENTHLRVALEGTGRTAGGRDAFGAVVRVKTSAGTLTKIKSGGSGFISEHDPRLLFGLGRDERAASIEVTWPSGKAERFEGNFAAGQFVLLREGAGRAEQVSVARTSLPDSLSRDEIFARSLKIAVGRPLPALAVKTLAGGEVTLASRLAKGRRTLVNVWATWCVPCRAEMPELQALAPKLRARGVDLVGLNVDAGATAQLVRSYLSDVRVSYENLIGGVPAIEGLYATDEQSVPLSILVDESGTVLQIIPGWSEKTRRRFDALAGLPPAGAPKPAERGAGGRR